jgi:hypothetical protein
MAESKSSTSVAARLDAIEAQIRQILEALHGAGGASGPSTTIELTSEELDKIGDALEDLDSRLTDRQRLYFLGILGAAAHHFQQVLASEGPSVENIRTIQVANAARIRDVKLSDAFQGLTKVEQGRLGSIISPGGDVMDSVGVGVGVACVGVDWSKDLTKDQLGGWRTNPAFGGAVVNPGTLGGLPGGFGR